VESLNFLAVIVVAVIAFAAGYIVGAGMGRY
jgi:hypothetical protein